MSKLDFVHATADKTMPPAARGVHGELREVTKPTVVPGASHVVMISHPCEIAATIEAAAGG